MFKRKLVVFILCIILTLPTNLASVFAWGSNGHTRQIDMALSMIGQVYDKVEHQSAYWYLSNTLYNYLMDGSYDPDNFKDSSNSNMQTPVYDERVKYIMNLPFFDNIIEDIVSDAVPIPIIDSIIDELFVEGMVKGEITKLAYNVDVIRESLRTGSIWASHYGDPYTKNTYVSNYVDADAVKYELLHPNMAYWVSCYWMAEKYLDMAVSEWMNGNRDKGAYYLGYALHFIADSSQPQHAALQPSTWTSMSWQSRKNSMHQRFEGYVERKYNEGKLNFNTYGTFTNVSGNSYDFNSVMSSSMSKSLKEFAIERMQEHGKVALGYSDIYMKTNGLNYEFDTQGLFEYDYVIDSVWEDAAKKTWLNSTQLLAEVILRFLKEVDAPTQQQHKLSVRIKTGDMPNAGTYDNVFFGLIDNSGKKREFYLDNLKIVDDIPALDSSGGFQLIEQHDLQRDQYDLFKFAFTDSTFNINNVTGYYFRVEPWRFGWDKLNEISTAVNKYPEFESYVSSGSMGNGIYTREFTGIKNWKPVSDFSQITLNGYNNYDEWYVEEILISHNGSLIHDAPLNTWINGSYKEFRYNSSLAGSGTALGEITVFLDAEAESLENVFVQIETTNGFKWQRELAHTDHAMAESGWNNITSYSDDLYIQLYNVHNRNAAKGTNDVYKFIFNVRDKNIRADNIKNVKLINQKNVNYNIVEETAYGPSGPYTVYNSYPVKTNWNLSGFALYIGNDCKVASTSSKNMPNDRETIATYTPISSGSYMGVVDMTLEQGYRSGTTLEGTRDPVSVKFTSTDGYYLYSYFINYTWTANIDTAIFSHSYVETRYNSNGIPYTVTINVYTYPLEQKTYKVSMIVPIKKDCETITHSKAANGDDWKLAKFTVQAYKKTSHSISTGMTFTNSSTSLPTYINPPGWMGF